MKAPKNKTVRCCVCGKDIHLGQPYEATKPRRGTISYSHKDCIKYRKECKK